MRLLSGDEPLSGSPEGYMRGLCLADRFVGDLVDAWKESGRYENATIILTADHSWRDDADPATISEPEWKRRVPLIVKCPGQRAGRIASTQFETINMGRILRLAFTGCADEGSVLTEINAAR
jgi:phosphoglycerol transferase MdoB-like AlkP superfamily enzyme